MELRAARESAGLSQKQVAAKAKTSNTHYQNIEYGKNVPNVQTAILIAKALDRNVGDMESLFVNN